MYALEANVDLPIELPRIDFELVGMHHWWFLVVIHWIDSLIKITFPFYLRIQITQRDSASILHSAYLWKQLYKMINDAANELDQTIADELLSDVKKHDEKMISCGIQFLT